MPTIRLTIDERRAMRKFVSSVRELMELGAESVGIIADHVGEHGAENADARMDAAIVESLRAIVDVMGRR